MYQFGSGKNNFLNYFFRSLKLQGKINSKKRPHFIAKKLEFVLSKKVPTEPRNHVLKS